MANINISKSDQGNQLAFESGEAMQAASTRATDAKGEISPLRLTSNKMEINPAKVNVWGSAIHQRATLAEDELQIELETFEDFGQRLIPIGRQGALFTEIITHTWILEVILMYNERHPDEPRNLIVLVQDCDDDAAYRHVAQQIDKGPTVEDYDRSMFFKRAVAHFGNQADAARACRVHKSTIGRALDVVRAVEIVGKKLQKVRKIAQRDAVWLADIVGRSGSIENAADPEAAAKVMAEFERCPILPANQLFARLKASVNEGAAPKKGLDTLKVGDREIGSISRKGYSGPIRIDIVNASDVELPDIMKSLRRALSKLRQSPTI